MLLNSVLRIEENLLYCLGVVTWFNRWTEIGSISACVEGLCALAEYFVGFLEHMALIFVLSKLSPIPLQPGLLSSVASWPLSLEFHHSFLCLVPFA